jgi:hypothetical protein
MHHQAKDSSWSILREEGAIIEEAADADDDADDTEEEKGGPESFDEKKGSQVVTAKVGMPVSPVHILPDLSIAGDGLT